MRLRTREGLSEEGFEAAPEKAHRHLARLLERGEPRCCAPTGRCCPPLLDDLAGRLDLDAAGSVEVVEEFAEARDEKLVKGEALVCHVVGTGDAGPGRRRGAPPPLTRGTGPRLADAAASLPAHATSALTVRTTNVRMPFTVRSPAASHRVTRHPYLHSCRAASPASLTLVLREVHTVKNQRLGQVAALALVGSIALAGCGSDDNTGSGARAPPPPAPRHPPTASRAP